MQNKTEKQVFYPQNDEANEWCLSPWVCLEQENALERGYLNAVRKKKKMHCVVGPCLLLLLLRGPGVQALGLC